MIDNGMKLVQQIDALTYNSRQVLNALIRSCIQSGSSNGFSVTRNGVKLTLDRTSIYKLYDFYQRWEKTGLSEDQFDELLDACDAMWETNGNSVTQAVATHAQICFLKMSDTGIPTASMGEASQDSLRSWCNKLKTADNKKGAIISAPIPLNLRTPLYDENLSTKSFSQFETYLFPMEYHTANMLGSKGDGESREAGGLNWTIDVDDTLKLTGNHMIIGSVSNGTKTRTTNYGKSTFTLSGGLESYAFGSEAVAFGASSVALGDMSFAMGNKSEAIGDTSSTFGNYNISLGFASTALGDHTISVGRASLSSGSNTVAGDTVYPFTLATKTNSYESVDCTTIMNSDGTCVTKKSGSDTVYGIYIDESAVDTDGIHISSNDTLVLFAQYLKSEGNEYRPYDMNGYAYDEVYVKAKKVTLADGQYFIELDQAIPVEQDGIGTIVGGYATRYYSTDYIYNTYTGAASNTTVDLYYGKNSVALNSNTIAAGENQTVVGSYNLMDRDARFVVGIGGYGNTTRMNGLTVGPLYGVMSTISGNSTVTVSDKGDGYVTNPRDLFTTISGGATLRTMGTYRGSDGNNYSTQSTVNSYVGAARITVKQNSPTTSYLDTVARVAVGAFGDGARSLLGGYDVTSAVESYSGMVIISSGPSSYVTANGSKLPFTKYMLARSTSIVGKYGINNSSNGNMGIYAQNRLEIAAQNESGTSTVYLESSGYLIARFSKITLHGDTYGTLTATDDCHSHLRSKISFESGRVTCPPFSGFYHSAYVYCPETSGYVTASSYVSSSYVSSYVNAQSINGAAHVFMSASYISTDSSGRSYYNRSGLVIPDLDTVLAHTGSKPLRPMIFMNSNKSDRMECHALAYYSDIYAIMQSITNVTQSVASNNGEYGTMVLAGYKSPVSSSTTLPLYIKSYPDAYKESTNNLWIPFGYMPYTYDSSGKKLTLNTASSGYMYASASGATETGSPAYKYPTSISISTGDWIHTTTTTAWSTVVSDVGTMMNGNKLDLTMKISFPKDMFMMSFMLFLGGGKYTIDSSVYKANPTYTFSLTNNATVYGTMKLNDKCPGQIWLTVCRFYKDTSGNLKVVNGTTISDVASIEAKDNTLYTLSCSNLTVPLRKQYYSGDTTLNSQYIVGSNPTSDIKRDAAIYGGTLRSAVTNS